MTAPRFERTPAPAGARISGFQGSAFIVDGTPYAALLLTPQRALPWTPPPLDALTPDDLALALALEPSPEFLLLGTGARQAFPPRAFVAALEAQGIGVEAMDSRAAARTWGVLRGEGRWIVAAFLPL